jgi:hypothetical protein
MSEPDSRSRPVQLAMLWGVLGFCALLVHALVRLTPIALEPIEAGMLWWQWAIYIGFAVFQAYAEGYKGFQTQMSPRVVARAQWLARNPKPVLVVFAPLFCMGFFYATRKRMIVTWALTAMIVAFVIAIRYLDQPWRGIIDGGVVVGLGWGLIAQLWFLAVGLRTTLSVDPDLPPGVARG